MFVDKVATIKAGEYWIFQNDESDNLETLSGLIVIEADQLRELIKKAMNYPGDCNTCSYRSSDGDLGERQTCEYDGDTDESLEHTDNGNCPYWKTNSPLEYCKKHKRWFLNGWELSCPDCFKEWECEQIEDSNKRGTE